MGFMNMTFSASVIRSDILSQLLSKTNDSHYVVSAEKKFLSRDRMNIKLIFIYLHISFSCQVEGGVSLRSEPPVVGSHLQMSRQSAWKLA